jgi:outer membrane protein assembly factor BamB
MESVLWPMPIPGLAHASPIIWGERVYVATAVKAGRAELKVGLYSERMKGRSQGFSASPVTADGKLYFTGELGDVFVLRFSRDFEVLACSRLDEFCLATPAISEGLLFFRTTENLVTIGAPSQRSREEPARW